MRKKHFYSFLVETTSITLDLGEIDMTKEERVHLISLIEANIHSEVIKTVLDNLDKENKKIFIKNLSKDNHELIWEHLEINIKNAKGEIKKSIQKTVKDLKEDIFRAKVQGKK